MAVIATNVTILMANYSGLTVIAAINEYVSKDKMLKNSLSHHTHNKLSPSNNPDAIYLKKYWKDSI